MPANYVLLEKITVGAAGGSSVTFSGIPQTGYTDLIVHYSMRSTFTGATGNTIQVSFNGSTSSFNDRNIYGDGSNVASSSSPRNIGATPSATALANTFGNGRLYIPNYTSSSFKSFVVDAGQENNTSEAYIQQHSGIWSSTSAITSITISSNVNNIAQFSTFYLYGVAAVGTTPAIVPYATGGDTIMTDGTYWYHAFLSSGTFTPAKSVSADVLVVAGGGGGGGKNNGGGGGAGGYVKYTAQALTTAVTCTVGAGGAGGTGFNPGSNGSNSQFASLTASVGGGGGGCSNVGGGVQNGRNGGSGGGSGNDVGTGGTGTSGQGFAGGSTTVGGCSSGGGGAGAAGTNANTSGNSAVAGGAGLNTDSSWATVTGTGFNGFYAGGGASGANISGGGSRITTRSNGGGGITDSPSGVANTGSGGVGFSFDNGNDTFLAGAGGSGIIIVRYAV